MRQSPDPNRLATHRDTGEEFYVGDYGIWTLAQWRDLTNRNMTERAYALFIELHPDQDPRKITPEGNLDVPPHNL